mmetsp:Transcript_31413/g.85878  ORF Transcript_31413/g.85878 Transcript_31413/m.85878 type:complete len:341 (-) Transcript_31413:477-1499(-)
MLVGACSSLARATPQFSHASLPAPNRHSRHPSAGTHPASPSTSPDPCWLAHRSQRPKRELRALPHHRIASPTRDAHANTHARTQQHGRREAAGTGDGDFWKGGVEGGGEGKGGMDQPPVGGRLTPRARRSRLLLVERHLLPEHRRLPARDPTVDGLVVLVGHVHAHPARGSAVARPLVVGEHFFLVLAAANGVIDHPRRLDHVNLLEAPLGLDRQHAVDHVHHLPAERAFALVEPIDSARLRQAVLRRELDALKAPIGTGRLVQREETSQHREEADPATPDVGVEPVVAAAVQHLGRGVALGATRLFEGLVLKHLVVGDLVAMRQSKVDDLANVLAVLAR